MRHLGLADMLKTKKEIVKCMAPCIIGALTTACLPSAMWWSTEKGKKAIWCLVYALDSRAERYASPEEHFVLWYFIVTVADRKWDRVFHFPAAIFTHQLNKDLFATGAWLHLPTFHIPKGRRQFCNQECNLHRGLHIHGKCWNRVRGLAGKKSLVWYLMTYGFPFCFRFSSFWNAFVKFF